MSGDAYAGYRTYADAAYPQVSEPGDCPTCHGYGWVDYSEDHEHDPVESTCEACDGSGLKEPA